MLTESQERMLAIVKKGKEDEVAAVFKKWGLQAVVVGEVTDDGLVHVYDGDELVAEVPAKSLADEAPTYHLEDEEPAYLQGAQNYDLSSIPEPADYNEALMKLMTSCSIASKEWVYEQYDHMVQTNTIVLPGSDAAVLRIRGPRRPSRSRRTATAGIVIWTRSWARRSPWPKPRETWPARARGR